MNRTSHPSLLCLALAAGALLPACAHSGETVLSAYAELPHDPPPYERRPVGSPAGSGVVVIASASTTSAVSASAEARIADEAPDAALQATQEDSIVAFLGPPTLAVTVKGARRCVVKLGRKRLGRAPLEVAVSEGRHPVVVECGKRRLFADRLEFVSGEEQRLELERVKKKPKKKAKHKARKRRRGRGRAAAKAGSPVKGSRPM